MRDRLGGKPRMLTGARGARGWRFPGAIRKARAQPPQKVSATEGNQDLYSMWREEKM